MNECFYVFRIIISCVFVYLDSIKVSHSFYDAKIGLISIAYIRFYQKASILLCNRFRKPMQMFSLLSLVVTRVIQKKVRPKLGHTNITSPVNEC